jgi:hypothetical protein
MVSSMACWCDRWPNCTSPESTGTSRGRWGIPHRPCAGAGEPTGQGLWTAGAHAPARAGLAGGLAGKVLPLRTTQLPWASPAELGVLDMDAPDTEEERRLEGAAGGATDARGLLGTERGEPTQRP